MRYFAVIDGRQQGPFTLDELEKAGVGPETYVWCKDMTDWQQAKEVGEICRHFRITLHDRMHPQPMVVEEVTQQQQLDSCADVPMRWRRYLMKAGVDASMEPEPKPDTSVAPFNWIFPAIIAILLCCPITGIVSLIYGIRSRKLWQRDKKKESHTAARKAKIWFLASIAACCFIIAIAIKALM